MAEADALSSFDYSKVIKPGKFVKFEAGKPLTMRILTTDPLVYESKFENKVTQEISLNTRFAFVVYNFTDEKAQILQATPNMSKKISEIHLDEDFGADIKQIDIKISPTGEKLERRYDIQVLPKAKTLTNAQIKEAMEIKLEDEIKEPSQRMSFYDPKDFESSAPPEEEAHVEGVANEEPINLDDIPF